MNSHVLVTFTFEIFTFDSDLFIVAFLYPICSDKFLFRWHMPVESFHESVFKRIKTYAI